MSRQASQYPPDTVGPQIPERVCAEVKEENLASEKVLMKTGFEFLEFYDNERLGRLSCWRILIPPERDFSL